MMEYSDTEDEISGIVSQGQFKNGGLHHRYGYIQSVGRMANIPKI
jgi:hypothetical protein